MPSKCVTPFIGCSHRSCEQQGIECGPTNDGCTGIIASCGECDAGLVCGTSWNHSKCTAPVPEAPCTPKTCEELGVTCGYAANGCGMLTKNCGDCPANFECRNGSCAQACVPRTCTEAQAQCGYAGDGCGGIIDCGVCPDGFVCGLGGKPYTCGR
jgi:hypothetical protein